MSYHVGRQLPTEEQLRLLRVLCEQTGKRYSTPRTHRQAEGRIRDLRISLHFQQQYPPDRPKKKKKQKPVRREGWGSLPGLLQSLKVACYQQDEERIRRLESKIDTIMEAPGQ